MRELSYVTCEIVEVIVLLVSRPSRENNFVFWDVPTSILRGGSTLFSARFLFADLALSVYLHPPA